MTSASGPAIGRFATSSSSSAAINIQQPTGCHGRCPCGCGCVKCSCRARVVISDPNREEYGGEGTFLPFGIDTVTQATTYTSTSSADSIDESSGAPAPTAITPAARLASFDTIRDIHGRDDPVRVAENKVDRYLNDSEDECPWERYLEISVQSDAGDDNPGFFGPAELDGSMRNNAPLSSNEHSMLSSFISSISAHTPSGGMSDVIRGVGGGLAARGGGRGAVAVVEPAHRYLRLN